MKTRRTRRLLSLVAALLPTACASPWSHGVISPADLSTHVAAGALSPIEPRPGPGPAPRARKALVLAIDGVRVDALAEAHSPNLDQLAQEGFFSDEAQTGTTTKSGPGWSNLLTGVWEEQHGVTSNFFLFHDLADHPDFINRIEAQLPGLQTAYMNSWEPLNRFATHADVRLFAPFEEHGDQVIVDAALEVLEQTDVDLLYVYLQSVDSVGHRDGFLPGGTSYVRQIEVVDEYVGALRRAIEQRASFREEEWLVVATTDHGGGGVKPTKHGYDVPEERTVFVLATDLFQREQASHLPGSTPDLVDVAPMVLDHFLLTGRP